MYINIQSDLRILYPLEKERQDIENSIDRFMREAFARAESDNEKVTEEMSSGHHLQNILRKAQELNRREDISNLKVLFLVIKMYYEINILREYADPSQVAVWLQSGDGIKMRQELICAFEDDEKIEDNKIALKLIMSDLSSFLFPLFFSYKFLLRYTQVDKNKLHTIILSLLINRCIPLGIQDEELNFFFDFWDNNLLSLSEKEPDLQQHWWKLAIAYYGSHAEIGESYTNLDSIKIRNAKTQAEWLKCFSKQEIELQELVFQKKNIELQIVTKNQHPEWTREECIRQAKGDLVDEKHKLQDLKTDSKWAEVLDYDELVENVPADDIRMQTYKQEAEQLFRIAAKMLHPDRRQYLLEGKTLSHAHEESLNALYNELMSVRNDTVPDPLAIAKGSYYSVNKLKRIVAHAETTWKLQDIKLPKLRFMIMGNTIEEQIDFLLNEEHLLESELAQLQAEIQLLFADKDNYQKECVVKDPEAIQTVKERFLRTIEECSKEVESLQEEFENLFEERE
jgi:hypothetical protein